MDNKANECCHSSVEDETTDSDFGLAMIAEKLGKSSALSLYWEGAAEENKGNIDGAISFYRRAFRLWPSLDSIPDGGIPRGVREEAMKAGIALQIASVDVALARTSKVMKSPLLLINDDLTDINTVLAQIEAIESAEVNNPENKTHVCKVCTFLNNPPGFLAQHELAHVLEKMIGFAERAWAEADWTGDSTTPGPLYSIQGGLRSLSIRVVEHWRYDVGGALLDPVHYDVDSVITIIGLLADNNDFDGGILRTNEPGDIQLEHEMKQRDVICFLSHKYHNITPITRGTRRSLVIELWQGGVGHLGR